MSPRRSMSPRTRRTADRLPPPTASEAAFERALASFDKIRMTGQTRGTTGCVDDAMGDSVTPSLSKGDGGASGTPEEGRDDFVERAYRESASYLVREPFASIGEAHRFHTKIVGVSFEGRQDVVAGLREGYELALERQPDNPHDANAIAVRYGQLQIGFLRKEIAMHVAPRMDSGTRYRARIESLTGGTAAAPGGGTRHRGVNILVERVAAESARSQDGALQRAHVRGDAVRVALIGDRQPREAQLAVLARVDAGKNTLAVFGTGRGKSYCFQYAAACRALASEQKTLVLYPLRALANDQYDALSRRLDGFGLRVHRANGAISSEEREDLMQALHTGDWDVILSTPEFLQFHYDAFTGKSRPSLVVVDEAHHLFESKHRAAYGRLGRTIAALGDPQVLALTATADAEAFEHIRRELRVDAWVIDPTVRENLHIVDARATKEKAEYLRRVFGDGGKAIVYCNSRAEATKTADALRKTYGNEVMFYHAGMNSPDRARVEQLFREGALRVVVATSAFGEGIDLPDVRHVVLYHLNFDFTSFNQQAGRAGRDGGYAQIHLLFGEADRRINEYIIDRSSPTIGVLRELYKGMRGLASGGVLRLSHVDIARTLEIGKADERTVAAALHIFEDENLVELGSDDDGRYVRFQPVTGKIDLSKNERFAEGEAEREDFARFCELVLKAQPSALEAIVNRPIYPERAELVR